MNTPITNDMKFICPVVNYYPFTFEKIKDKDLHIEFDDNFSLEQLLELGYCLVEPTPKPVGDVVFEKHPVRAEDGTYKQVWDTRKFTAEELSVVLTARKDELLKSINEIKVKSLARGTPVDFGDTYGIQHIQLRDGDRANILGLRIKAESIVNNQSEAWMGIRTYENVLVPLTADAMMNLSWTILNSYEEVMRAAWDMEDLVKAAENLEELPELPEYFTPPLKVVSNAGRGSTETEAVVEEAVAE